LRYASKSAGNLSDALKAVGIEASPEIVRTMLKRLGYRMQGNWKVKSNGIGHPDWDAQFQHILNFGLSNLPRFDNLSRAPLSNSC
jgi:hypothetical protein